MASGNENILERDIDTALREIQKEIGIKEIRLLPWVSTLTVVRMGGGSMP